MVQAWRTQCAPSPSPTGRSTRTPARARRPARPRRRRSASATSDLAGSSRSTASALPKLGVLRQPRLRAVHGAVRDRGPAPAPRRARQRRDVLRLRGLRRLPPRPRRARARFTQREAAKLIRKLPAADVLSATARPTASTTTPTTPPTSASTRCASGCSSTGRGSCCTATRTRPEPARRPARRHADRLRQRRARRRPRSRAVSAPSGNKRRMKPFVIDRHGRLVFPSNFLPELDFSVIPSLETLDAVIRRDFETKAPTGTDILERIEAGDYDEPLRADARRGAEPVLGQPLRDDDVREAPDALARRAAHPRRHLPADPARRGRTASARSRRSARLRRRCRRRGTRRPRTGSSRTLFDVFGHRPHHATELPAIKPTVAEILADPTQLTFCLDDYDPDYPVLGFEDIRRLPRGRARARGAAPLVDGAARPVPVGPGARAAEGGRRPRRRRLRGRCSPRATATCSTSSAGCSAGERPRRSGPRRPTEARAAGPAPYPAVRRARAVRACMPRIEALAVVKGEHACTQRRPHPQRAPTAGRR